MSKEVHHDISNDKGDGTKTTNWRDDSSGKVYHSETYTTHRSFGRDVTDEKVDDRDT